jgi:hypothetical protein
MARIILHLLKSDDCSSTTFNEVIEFIQSHVKSKLFETHTEKPGTKTSFSVSAIPDFEEYFAISETSDIFVVSYKNGRI